VLGPAPFDPNTISQGVPPDSRVDFGDQIFAPLEGTPMPPGALPPGAPPPPVGPESAPLPPAQDQAPVAPPPGNSLNGEPIPPLPPAADGAVPPPPPPNDGGIPSAAPSAFAPNGTGPAPSVAVAQYNPKTGAYVTPDGHMYRQADLVAPGAPKTWQDLLPT
jgi:hypothetical protein